VQNSWARKMAKKTKKKIGRPPKREGERLSKNRTFRVRGNLDDWLQAASAASGRSVSEEIEYRLERSFQVDREAVELESLKARLTRVETQLYRVDTVERKRLISNIDPEYSAFGEAMAELLHKRDELERQRDEIESKIAEAEERQRRLKQP
jgi:chromosome segregation ATPase